MSPLLETFANASVRGWKSSSKLPLVYDYLVVGGGAYGNYAGGGAGGYRTGIFSTLPSSFTVTVGGADSPSSLDSIVSQRGGNGGNPGSDGGSGGGSFLSNSFGYGNTPAVSPPQGNNGAAGTAGDASKGHGGGGGAGSAAVKSTVSNGSNGGNGVYSSITGALVGYAGGGGGGSGSSSDGLGGIGSFGGGQGGKGGAYAGNGTNATANTGAGGGGKGFGTLSDGTSDGHGGSGIAVIRYPAIYPDFSNITGLSYTKNIIGEYKIYTFTAGSGTVYK